MSKAPLLEVQNLRTKFSTDRGTVNAVDGISFDIYPGEVFGLVGESGSGKSVSALSLLQLLDENGNYEADVIRYKETDLLSYSDSEMRNVRGNEISIIFQDLMSSLNPVMTVGEQIAEVYRHHISSDESKNFSSEMVRKYMTGTNTDSESWQQAVELLDTVGIPDPEIRATEYPHQLSGGMRQRVVIAQALAGDPSLIIADEPTTALDVSVEAQILNELVDLRDEYDVSILFITHDLGVIHEICDRVAVMYAGKLMERGTTEELFDKPEHPYTQGLLDSIPRVTDNKDRLDVIEGSVPDLTDKSSGCPFRERCEHSFEMCDKPLTEYKVGDSHVSWCHLHNDQVETDAGEKIHSTRESARGRNESEPTRDAETIRSQKDEC